MAFQRPTLAELVERVQNDLESRLNNNGSLLRRAVLVVIARVIAGVSHLLHGHLEWIFKQVFPDTADEDQLKRWSSIFGVTQKPADFATGLVVFTGVNTTIIPQGTEIQRSDGKIYITDVLGTISAGQVIILVVAEESGVDQNTVAGNQMQMVSPLLGVDNIVTVDVAGLVNGLDAEALDLLRQRLIDRIQFAPLGGSANDYESWALSVTGVTRAFVYPNNQGPGTVGVSFVQDNEVSIIPLAPKITEVQDYINIRKPVTAAVTVFAPIALAVNFTIDLIPDTGPIRIAVEAELKDLLKRQNGPGAVLLRTHISEAISIAAGEVNHILSIPAADVTPAASEIVIFGAITWL